jgi:hypothetical protein
MAADMQILTKRLKVAELTGPGRSPMEKPASNLNAILKKQSQLSGCIDERKDFSNNIL